MRDGQPNPCSVRESAYDALVETSPKYQEEAEYDDRATWAIHVACFIIHVYTRAFGDALQKTWMSWNTPLFFSARGIVASKMRKQEGCRYERRRSVQKEGC